MVSKVVVLAIVQSRMGTGELPYSGIYKACISNVLCHFSAEQAWVRLPSPSMISFVNKDKTEVTLIFACSIPGSLLTSYSVIVRNTVRLFAMSREGEGNEGLIGNANFLLPWFFVCLRNLLLQRICLLCVLLCVPLLTGCLPLHH